jgi:hypothetical protein
MTEILKRFSHPETFPSLCDPDPLLQLIIASITEEVKNEIEPHILGISSEYLVGKIAEQIIQATDKLRVPMSLDDFQAQRENLLVEIFEARISSETTNEEIIKRWEEWVLNISGWFVTQEYEVTDYVYDHAIETPTRTTFAECINDYSHQVLKSKDEIVREGIGAASELIRDLRLQGYRTMITIGGFDLGTTAHAQFLDEIGEKSGCYTAIIALVSDDQELRITKGPDRPFSPLEDRVTSLVSHRATHWVVPVHLPDGIQNYHDLTQFWTNAHQQLRPHFRVIGEKGDPNFDLYQEQCEAAHITLLYSETPRQGRATDLIRQIQSS